MCGVVDGDEHAHAVGALPRKRDERVVRAVAVPRWCAFKQPPFAIADSRAAEHFEQAGVKLLERFVHRFLRRAAEMWRDAFEPSLQLALVEETQARREESDDGGGLVLARGKGRGGAGFVVVFEEAREFVLVVESGVEV